eukprot:GHVN01049105.1.p2 GENE.GHVN01049105.1~~GHVN01049105.1.p2  ORF type:complete len:110 (-),score=39.43 GHVN01049105.1:293-622(-)
MCIESIQSLLLMLISHSHCHSRLASLTSFTSVAVSAPIHLIHAPFCSPHLPHSTTSPHLAHSTTLPHLAHTTTLPHLAPFVPHSFTSFSNSLHFLPLGLHSTSLCFQDL